MTDDELIDKWVRENFADRSGGFFVEQIALSKQDLE